MNTINPQIELREGFRAYLSNRNLKEVTIKDYLFYINKIDLPLDQKNLDLFITKYNNPVARAFIENLKDYIIRSKLTEDLEAVRSLDVPRITGRKGRKIPKVLSEEEVYELCKAMKRERDKFMLMITYYAGLRLTELLTIKPYDFNWKKWWRDRTKSLELKVMGKGSKERIVFIPSWLAERLEIWIKQEVSQRPNASPKSKLFSISHRRWQYILQGISKRVLGKDIHPHLLRHSIATSLLDQGLQLEEVKEFLGHQSIAVTQIYTHISLGKLKNRYESLKGSPPDLLKEASQKPVELDKQESYFQNLQKESENFVYPENTNT